MYGYDHIPVHADERGDAWPVFTHDKQKFFSDRVQRRGWWAWGCYEILNYSFISPQMAARSSGIACGRLRALNPVVISQSAGRGHLGDAHRRWCPSMLNTVSAQPATAASQTASCSSCPTTFEPRDGGRTACRGRADAVRWHVRRRRGLLSPSRTRRYWLLAKFGVRRLKSPPRATRLLPSGPQGRADRRRREAVRRWARFIPTWPSASASTRRVYVAEVDLDALTPDGEALLRREAAAQVPGGHARSSPWSWTKSVGAGDDARDASARPAARTLEEVKPVRHLSRRTSWARAENPWRTPIVVPRARPDADGRRDRCRDEQDF